MKVYNTPGELEEAMKSSGDRRGFRGRADPAPNEALHAASPLSDPDVEAMRQSLDGAPGKLVQVDRWKLVAGGPDGDVESRFDVENDALVVYDALNEALETTASAAAPISWTDSYGGRFRVTPSAIHFLSLTKEPG